MGRAHLTYARLVRDEADMVGHVAYAMYKRDKLRFVEVLRHGEARDPTCAEIDAFILAANLELRIGAYRAEAEQSLELFTQEVVGASVAQVERRFDRELATRLAQAKSWWRAIAESLAANLLAAVLIALLAVLLYGSRIGVVNLGAEVFGYRVMPAEAAGQPGE